MQKLICTIGLSGSGKSSWTVDFIRKNKGWVRTNRDSLREELTGLKACDYNKNPDGKTEKIINDLQHEQIRYFLNKGLNVIIDNTHLKQSYINEILDKYLHMADIELKWFYCSVLQAKLNVFNRDGGDTNVNYIERQQGQFDILRKQITQDYYDQTNHIVAQNKSLPHAIICDLDGTLSEAPGKQIGKWHFDRDYTKDFVVEPVQELLHKFEKDKNITIIFISGREDKYQEQTEQFLTKVGITNYLLYMRKTGDSRRDSVVKQKIFKQYIQNKYYVLFSVDDRLQVVEECWNKLGIFNLNVNQGLIRY